MPDEKIEVRKVIRKPFILRKLKLHMAETGKTAGQILEETYENQCHNGGAAGRCGALIADLTRVLNNYKGE